MAIASRVTRPDLSFLNPSTWRYQAESGRDLRLDLLRGMCVMIMIIDHVGGAESWFYTITGGNHFVVSAAEAFVFISGLTAGMVYMGRFAKIGVEASLMKVLQRAWKLYTLTLGLTFAFAGLSAATQMPWAADGLGNPVDFVVGVFTLHTSYYLADIALMYTLLMLTAPLTLILLHKQRPWVVLGVSWALYAGYQLKPDLFSVPFPQVGVFPLAAWQVLFTTGLVIGWHRKQIAAWFNRHPQVYLPYFALMTLLVAGLILMNRHDGALIGQLFPGTEGREILNDWFDKIALRPSRLAADAIFFQWAWMAAGEVWKPLYGTLGWLLVPLGQNSLYVYALHPFLLILAHFSYTAIPSYSDTSASTNALLQAGGFLLIWVMVKRKILFAVVPR